jgi:hypothetical protein
MTRRISLTIGTAVAALAVGVSVASAGAPPIWHDGIKHSDFWNYDAQTGQKVANTSPGVQPGDLAGLYSSPSDVGGQQVPVLRRSAPDSPGNVDLRRRVEARNDGHGPHAATDEPAVVVVSDGDDIAWAELGVGLGIGVLLGLGLIVGLGGPGRPLPH